MIDREFIVNAVWVVVRTQGEYSDRTETVVVACLTEEGAKQFVALAEQQWRSACVLEPIPTIGSEGWSEKLQEWAPRFRSLLALDPDAVIDTDGIIWVEHPHYHYTKAELVDVRSLKATLEQPLSQL